MAERLRRAGDQPGEGPELRPFRARLRPPPIAQVDVDQLNVTVAGTANATLAGRPAKTTAILRGISSLDATGLSSKDATIGADGAATIRADVTNTREDRRLGAGDNST